MSNQVFSGQTPRYFPSGRQQDVLTLIKNVAGPPAIGYATKSLTTFVDLFWGRLNGSNTIVAAGVVNYPLYQVPETKPYWTLSANSAVLGGGSLLYSHIDQVIGVDAVIPFGIKTAVAGTTFSIKLAVMVLDPANAYAVVASKALYGANIYGSTAVANADAYTNPSSLSTDVRVKAGQAVSVRAFIHQAYGVAVPAPLETVDLHIQDDTNGLATVPLECSLVFSKL